MLLSATCLLSQESWTPLFLPPFLAGEGLRARPAPRPHAQQRAVGLRAARGLRGSPFGIRVEKHLDALLTDTLGFSPRLYSKSSSYGHSVPEAAVAPTSPSAPPDPLPLPALAAQLPSAVGCAPFPLPRPLSLLGALISPPGRHPRPRNPAPPSSILSLQTAALQS